MALETFLIALKDPVSSVAVRRVVAVLRDLGGRVEIITAGGKVMIAALDNAFAERVRRLSDVKLVGGVTIGKRRLSQITAVKTLQSQ